MNLRTLFCSLLFAAVALSPLCVRADDEAAQLSSLLSKQAPAIVTVKASLKSSMKGADSSGQDSESPITMQGVVVKADGLVMISNLALSPTRAMELMGRGGGDKLDIKITATNIKVIFADDEKEYDAFLAATDTNLDLAFVKIESAGGKTFTALDFTNPGTATIGQKVVGLTRLSKGYDFAPYYQTARISGAITKPRSAMMLDGGISGFGLPIFALTGEPVGVLSTILSAGDDSSGTAASYAMFLRMLTGGGSTGAFLIPATAVRSVIEQADKRSVVVAADRAKKKSEKPVTLPAKPIVKPAPKKP